MFSNKNQKTSNLESNSKEKNIEQKLEETKLKNSFLSTDSTNELDTNIKTFKYIFENNKKIYNISLILKREKIKINVNSDQEKNDFYYEIDFTQEELNNMNKLFRLCSNIEESFDYLSELFKETQNQLSVSESNDLIRLEKKIQFFVPLKIEIPKIYINKKISNNDIKIKINDNILLNKDRNKNSDSNLKMEGKKNIENIQKNYLENEEDFNKAFPCMNKIDNLVNKEKNEENKNSFYSFLNKKRGSISNLSDISGNSNDNEYNNKKIKNNLEKEQFLKIFSDNNSVNSGDSNEKFFMKILKKKRLEKENNDKVEKDKNNDNLNKNEEEYISYLYGDQDSSDEIKDDIDFFRPFSPVETPKSPDNTNKINNNNHVNNNNSLYSLYKNEKHKSNHSLFSFDNIFNNNEILFHKNNNYISNNYKNGNLNNLLNNKDNRANNKNKDNYEEISINDGSSDWSLNNSYNIIGRVYEKDSHFKKNKDNKSYKIINKNSVECCNMDLSFGYFEKNQYSNKLFSMDSKIISNFKEFDFIINYLKTKFNKEIVGSIRIYRATEDGDKAESFHRLCDGNTNIIILIKTKNGKKIGGYTSIGFSNISQSILDDTAFIFSIDKREIYPNIKGKTAIDSYKNLGPTFSGDSIKIFDNFLQNGGITSKIGLNYYMNEDYQINDGKQNISVEEIEVLEFLE